MTKLEMAIQKLTALPEGRRELMLDVILDLADQPRHELTDAQLAEVRLGLKEADEGDFATDEEMAALWKKFGL